MKKTFSSFIDKIRGKPFSWLIEKTSQKIGNIIFFALCRLFLFIPGLNQLFLYSVKYIAISGKSSNLCIKKGFLPVPIHFYYPIPDIEDLLKRDVWQNKSKLGGILFDDNNQVEFLHMITNGYNMECDFPPLKLNNDPYAYYTENNAFSYGCAATLNCIIRYYKPNRIIEIGSGMSSLIISSAVQKNKEINIETNYTIIDPYPSAIINELPGLTNLVISKVELLDTHLFNALDKHDILFIDSSHSVKIGSDVNYMILDVLPFLRPGGLVHFHDISLPYEYPKTYFVSEAFRPCWTEQYLLQAFLSYNSEYEVLIGLSYVMNDHPEHFNKAFPLYDPTVHKLSSGSFWIRRKTTESKQFWEVQM